MIKCDCGKWLYIWPDHVWMNYWILCCPICGLVKVELDRWSLGSPDPSSPEIEQGTGKYLGLHDE